MPLLRRLFGVLMLPWAMAAQADDLISIYEDALLNDQQLSAAQAERDAGLETVVQARAGLLPEVSLQAQNLWNRNQYQVQGGEIEHRRQNQTYSIQLAQPVFRWKNWILYQQGSQQTALAISRFYSAQQTLMLRVATAYFEVLSTEEVLDTLRQQQVADVQLLASARKQFELGNVSIADVYEAQASADRALAASIKANSDVELARQGRHFSR